VVLTVYFYFILIVFDIYLLDFYFNVYCCTLRMSTTLLNEYGMVWYGKQFLKTILFSLY